MKTIQELSEKFSNTKVTINYSDGVKAVGLMFKGLDEDGDPVRKNEHLTGADVSADDQILLMQILERSRINKSTRLQAEAE